MSPTELFQTNVDKAEKLATSLCWRYRVSGALTYQEEAKSEARVALWRACTRFDPGKQELEIRKIREYSATQFWDPLFGLSPSLTPPPSNPADNFWIWAVRQINGRVIDWFRSYHLIKRMAEGEHPSMVYHERFLSMTRAKKNGSSNGDGDGGSSHDYDECLPSSDRADGCEEVDERRKEIAQLIADAELDLLEREVLALAFGEEEMEATEISDVVGITPRDAQVLIKTSIEKLRIAAGVVKDDAAYVMCGTPVDRMILSSILEM